MSCNAPRDRKAESRDQSLIELASPRSPVEGVVVDIEALLLRDRNERLRRLVQNTRGGPNTEVVVTVGEPFIEVIGHVLSHAIDLVIVGEHAVGKGDAPQLDSGVMHLLRKCPVPVWVMRPSRARKLRILALVDPDPSDPVRDGLNDLVLQLATSLASREGGELHVGHAWSLTGESRLRLSPYLSVPGTDVDAIMRATGAVHGQHRRNHPAVRELFRAGGEAGRVC